jgi:hypothetical protein
MSGQKRRLWVQLLVCALALFVLDRTVRSYGHRHFNSFLRLDKAVREAATATGGDPCIVLSGGSETVSAIDEKELAAVLLARGVKASCIADLSIGATYVDVRFMALREYVGRGGKLDTLVLGFRGLALVDSPDLTPGYYLGNNAALYDWSTMRDLATYYRRPSFEALDNSLRVALLRQTSIGANRQAFWARVNAIEIGVGMRPSVLTNRFGVVDEFMKIADEQPHVHASTWQIGRWYAEILRVAKDHHARVFFAKLPALKRAEEAYFTSAESRASFDTFVDTVARENGGRLIDLSAEPWMEDSLLIDGLHFDARGATLVSRALASALADAR